MAPFDAQLSRVRDFVGGLGAAGRSVREVASRSCSSPEGLPVRVGPGANPNVILRSDTYVELGNPAVGSCGIVLWAADASLVADGRVLLVGPDISEAPGGSLPFGQILIVAGRDLEPDDYPAIGQAQYVGDQIEGFMVRSSSRSVWARVSKDVAGKGFDFACLGRALIAIYKSSLPKIDAMEVVFVTSDASDVRALEAIAADVRAVGLEMLNAHWKARGYELDCNLDCRACHDKQVCDDIRKVIAAKSRKERAVHV